MKTIHKLYEHLDWANTRILGALVAQGSGDLKALRLIAHLLQVERVWLTRLQGKISSPIPLWSDPPSLEQCAQLAQENRTAYAAYFAGLTEEQLDAVVRYRNSSGHEFDNSVRDILTHVALHGQYHRGQINALLRAGGNEPADVDYITFVR